jgi:hypothetical protein
MNTQLAYQRYGFHIRGISDNTQVLIDYLCTCHDREVPCQLALPRNNIHSLSSSIKEFECIGPHIDRFPNLHFRKYLTRQC